MSKVVTDEVAIEPVRELELPKAKDAALTFYAVNLYGQEGLWPCILHTKDGLPRLHNCKDPFDLEDLPMFAHTREELAKMERPTLLYERDPVTKRAKRYHGVRTWRNASPFFKDSEYFEDLGFCRGNADRWVQDVVLYCPMKEKVGGTLQDHGPYAGVGQKGWGTTNAKGGECHACTRDKNRASEMRALAMSKIREIFITLNAEIPQALSNAMLRQGMF